MILDHMEIYDIFTLQKSDMYVCHIFIKHKIPNHLKLLYIFKYPSYLFESTPQNSISRDMLIVFLKIL